jgi:predicted dehydrogenase
MVVDHQSSSKKSRMSRRNFVQSAATAGAGLLLASKAYAQTGAEASGGSKMDDINIALIGAGSQGRVLMQSVLKIPNVRFKAVCDIWEYSSKYASNVLGKYGQPVNVYSDYEDLLAKEKDLDAVLIATPDLYHAPHTVACLKAGLHVYCEKEMSNSLESAKEMILAARQAGKLLQIGHQRRSNPRYKHGLKLIEKDKVLGRITHINGQWNRPVQEPLGYPKKYPIDKETLKKYGYDTMERFRNWRRFSDYSGGPIADLGSHQIDIYNWFLDAQPKAVLASGGLDYYDMGDWYDNVLTIYEYETEAGPVRAFYQLANTTSHGGYFETFMGDQGSMVISEDVRKGYFFREVQAKRREWEDDAEKVAAMDQQAIELKIGETRRATGQADPESLKMEEDLEKPIHQPHLENFFDAVRNGTPLNCPGEIGYETAVTVLRVNEAMKARRTLEFKPEEFLV